MSGDGTLIEDEDGAPYPPCRHCGEQIAPNPHAGGEWAHVYRHVDGRHWYLFNCQQKPYGVHVAEREVTP